MGLHSVLVGLQHCQVGLHSVEAERLHVLDCLLPDLLADLRFVLLHSPGPGAARCHSKGCYKLNQQT